MESDKKNLVTGRNFNCSGETQVNDHDARQFARRGRETSSAAHTEPEIAWHFAPRIEPGEYKAYSRSAKIYRDGKFKRWVVAVQFELEEAGTRLTWYLNLGQGPLPKAGRRSNCWQAWVAANGRPPTRRDRLSPRVFVRRWATVLVEDTAKDFRQMSVSPDNSYSVIRSVREWQTGGSSQ